jgi:hypothetical protein
VPVKVLVEKLTQELATALATTQPVVVNQK